MREQARRTFVVVIIVALALLVWRMAEVFLLAFAGILLAVMFLGLAGLVSRYIHVSTKWSLLIVVILAVLLCGLVGWFIGDQLVKQTSQLIDSLPGSIERIEKALSQSKPGRYILDSIASKQPNIGQGFRVLSRATGYASVLIGIIVGFIVVVFTAIFFAVNPDLYKKGTVLLMPSDKAARISGAIDESGRVLRYWLLGQGIAMTFVGAATAAGLWMAGIQPAILLGIIAGLFDFVPFVGPVAAAVPGVLIAAGQGWTKVIYALLVYIIVQQIESNLIVPVVQKKAVSLPPAVTLLAVVAFGSLFGLPGVILATPLTAVAIVWVKKLYMEDVLGKQVKT